MTSRELAVLAGVSQATVSRVLNNSSNVSEKKRQKVLELAKSYDFELDGNAKSLRTHKINRVGILLSPNFIGFDENLFWASIYTKLHSQLHEMGYTAFPIYDYKCSTKEILNKVIAQKQADHMILISTNDNYKEEDLTILFNKKIDFVCLYDKADNGCYYANHKVNVIEVDFREAGRLAGEFLYERGHRRIALQISRSDHSSNSRGQGFYQGLKRLGSDYKITEIGEVDGANPITFQGGYKTAKENIDTLKECTAILATNDASAMGMIIALQEHRINVPDDISIIGINNIPMCTWWRPHLTTVAFNSSEIAENACKMLCKTKEMPTKMTISPKLLIRDTVR